MAVTRLQKELLHEPPSAAPVKMERDSRAKQSGAKAEAAGGPQRVPWLGVLFTLCWMTASAALIFINKQLMVDEGFRFPFALTSLGQLSSAVLAWVATRVGLTPLLPPPSLAYTVRNLLPVSASFALVLFLGNVAYLGLSVAFINICKASTPAVTLLVGLALGLERLSKPALVGTMLISLGVAMATASEVDTGHMHWPSFLCFNASIVFEAFRMVLSERLLGRGRFDVFNALIYMGPITFAFLSIGSYAFEWNQGLSTQGIAIVRARPDLFALAAGTAFLVNLFTFLAIRHVSSTSFKVAGCLKNVLVVVGGVAQGDVVTAQEVQGYGVSMLGFMLYSAARRQQQAPAPKQA